MKQIDVYCSKGGRHKARFSLYILSDWESGNATKPRIYCTKCLVILPTKDIIRMINAAMEFTADEANDIIKGDMIPGLFEDDPIARYYRVLTEDLE